MAPTVLSKRMSLQAFENGYWFDERPQDLRVVEEGQWYKTSPVENVWS